MSVDDVLSPRPNGLRKSATVRMMERDMLPRTLGNTFQWEICSPGGRLSKDKCTFTCTSNCAENTYAVAAGPELPSHGLSDFLLTIVRSEGNQGVSMLLGMAECTISPQGATVLGRVWGLAPWNGRCLGFKSAESRDPARRHEEVRGDALMGGDMRGTAAGARVRVRVDMYRKQLFFLINDAQQWTLARDDKGEPIVLPSRGHIRPLVRCARADDCVEISAFTHTPILDEYVAPPPLIPQPIELPPEPEKPPPPPTGDAKEVANLLQLVSSLRSELDTTKMQLERERELRKQAEAIAKAATRRVDEQRRIDRRLGKDLPPRPSADAPERVLEIEASLMREVLLAGGGATAGHHESWAPSPAEATSFAQRKWSMMKQPEGIEPMDWQRGQNAIREQRRGSI